MTQSSRTRRDHPDEPALLRLSRPDDLVVAVPYLVGFHPRDSLVLLGLRRSPADGAPSRVSVVVRMDLADVSAGPDPLYTSVLALTRAETTSIAALVFCRDLVRAQQMTPLVAPVEDACGSVGLPIASWFFVGEDRWTMGRRDGAGFVCGEAFEHASDSVVAAEATYAGLVARPDRAALEQVVAPEPAERRHQLLTRLTQARRDRLDCSATVRQRCRRSDIRAIFAATRALPLVEVTQVIRFGAALADLEVRDACWLALEAGRIEGTDLWFELSRMLPDEFRAPPLFLFAWQQWRSGSGALAGIAIEECLRCDPAYSAAQLLDGALSNGLDPFRTPRLRKGA